MIVVRSPLRALGSLAAVVALACTAGASSMRAGEPPLFDPETGYRLRNYQAATPDTAPPATRIWLDEIPRLVAARGAILLDVSPAEGAGPDPVSGTWRLSKPRANLQGSVWLPDVGKGVLDGRMIAYLTGTLDRLTAGNKAHPIVVYCRADCWMSWNAVKRLAAAGYTALYWFSEGTDGARDFDFPLVPAVPVPLSPR